MSQIQNGNRYSDEYVEQALALVRSGKTQADVADMLGVSQGTLSGWVRRGGQAPAKPRRVRKPSVRMSRDGEPWTEREDDLLETCRANGRRWDNIAYILHRSQGACKSRADTLSLMEAGPGTHGDGVLMDWPSTHTFHGRDVALKPARVPARFIPAHIEAVTGSAAALCADSIGANKR